MHTSASPASRSASISAPESPTCSACVSGRSSIARVTASSSPSRSSRLPIRVSGFRRVVPPGCSRSTTPPIASISGPYSPLGSMFSKTRPKTRWRNGYVFDSELLPQPSCPITITLASVSSPAV